MTMKETEGERKKASMWNMFVHADAVDMLLMALGFLGAMLDGLSNPARLYVVSRVMNNLGEISAYRSEQSFVGSSIFLDDVNKNSVMMLYLACSLWVACFLEGYCWARTAERQTSRMRTKYLKAVLRQDIEYFDLQLTNTSQVVTSITSDSLVIQDVISEKVPNFIANAATFVGGYVTAFFLMWRLAVVVFPSLILLVVPGIIYGRIFMALARKRDSEYDKAGFIVEQAVSSIRTVYSFVAEKRTLTEFSVALEDSVKLGLKQGLAKGISVGVNGITFLIWAFTIWYGSRLVMYHHGRGGNVHAVAIAIVVGGLSMGSGLANIKYFSEASSAMQRIMEVINRAPRIDSDDAAGDVVNDLRGDVEFRAVDFGYPSRPETLVFKGFNLRVPAGKTTALVGASGSGKSTVISLLERFYDPVCGEVMLDGMDIRRLQLKWLRSQIGLVSQEPSLFATSIKENILFGKQDAGMDEVVAAAKAANAHNFITQLPLGYDTQVGERGVQMSGGQKQRIAIARAVIKAPKILLLDEATSALDSESERVVQKALDVAAMGRTTIVIAHRLSTIRNADVIAVLQSGQVVEYGSHDDLMKEPSGAYATLVRLKHDAAKAADSEEVCLPSFTTPVVASLKMQFGDNLDCSSSSVSQSDPSSAAAFCRPKSENAHRDSTEVSTEAEGGDGLKSAKRKELPTPSFWRLIALNAPEWKQAVMGLISAALCGTVHPIYAFFMGSAVAVFFSKDHEEIRSQSRIYSLILVALALVCLLINMCQHYNFAYMGEYLTKRVRERMLSKILTFEVAWFDQDENSTGSICSRLAKEATAVRSLVGDRMALLVQTFSTVTISFTMGLVLAWRLGLLMIGVQPLIIACYYMRKVLLKKMSDRGIKAQSDSSKLAAEAVFNHRTITAFSMQECFIQKFEFAQEGPRQEAVRQSWYAGIGLGGAQGLMNCTWSLNFWYGGHLVVQGYITAKAFFQTFILLISTGRAIADAGSMTTDLAKGADAVKSAFAVLDRRSGIEPDSDGHSPKSLMGNVDFEEVEFAYPTRPQVSILQCFSLSIKAGQSMALVGTSGSGKSTVISLIERFYDPTRGSIMIDGMNIKSYHLHTLRRHIALVGQEPTLFAGTVKENIIYGTIEDETPTDAEVEAAARSANAHDFICALRDGYGTYCGDRGVQLSGGQKQRIAIARAILKNPAMLLLDEATSALDGQSESIVQQALDRIMIGRTSVVVAHRLSTVQNCHTIAVLDKGAVVEKGTHAALLAKGPAGIYHSLVYVQTRQQNIGDIDADSV